MPRFTVRSDIPLPLPKCRPVTPLVVQVHPLAPGSGITHALKARRSVTIVELLDWAYLKQRVASATGTALHGVEADVDDETRQGSSCDGVAALGRRGVLGCKIDGGGPTRGVAPAVHPDAVAVAEAVERVLARMDARLANRFRGHLRTGFRPAATAETPRAYPVEPDRTTDRHGWSMVGTTRVDYKLSLAGTTVVKTVVGRNRVGVVRPSDVVKAVRHEVLYCPLVWEPDPEALAAERWESEAWEGMLVAVKVELRPVRLKGHTLVDGAGAAVRLPTPSCDTWSRVKMGDAISACSGHVVTVTVAQQPTVSNGATYIRHVRTQGSSESGSAP